MSSGDSPTHHNRTAEAFDFTGSNQSDPRPYILENKALPVDQSGGRSSPVATTSRDIGVQSNRGEDKVGGDKARGEIQASVLVEPGGGRDKDKEEGEEKELFGSPTLNNDDGGDDNEGESEKKSRGIDGGYEGRDKRDRKDDKFRKNGNIDKLDGVWVPKEQKKTQNEQDEDNCIVKCLYVTMTCCECSIM